MLNNGLFPKSVQEFISKCKKDYKKNLTFCREILGLGKESQVPVVSFSIDEEIFIAEEGKYGIALFLLILYHAIENEKGNCHSSTFEAMPKQAIGSEYHFRFISSSMRDLLWAFYNEDICIDALTNPATEHLAIRKLLTDESLGGPYITVKTIHPDRLTSFLEAAMNEIPDNVLEIAKSFYERRIIFEDFGFVF